MGRIPPIRLPEQHHVDVEIVETARVIQELADRDALDKRRGLPVKVEQALRHELKDERRNEDVPHAPNAESMLDGQQLAGRQVREAGRCLNSTLRPDRDHRRPRNTGRDSRLKLILNRWHR
jgi:hypothetical protein